MPRVPIVEGDNRRVRLAIPDVIGEAQANFGALSGTLDEATNVILDAEETIKNQQLKGELINFRSRANQELVSMSEKEDDPQKFIEQAKSFKTDLLSEILDPDLKIQVDASASNAIDSIFTSKVLLNQKKELAAVRQNLKETIIPQYAGEAGKAMAIGNTAEVARLREEAFANIDDAPGLVDEERDNLRIKFDKSLQEASVEILVNKAFANPQDANILLNQASNLLNSGSLSNLTEDEKARLDFVISKSARQIDAINRSKIEQRRFDNYDGFIKRIRSGDKDRYPTANEVEQADLSPQERLSVYNELDVALGTRDPLFPSNPIDAEAIDRVTDPSVSNPINTIGELTTLLPKGLDSDTYRMLSSIIRSRNDESASPDSMALKLLFSKLKSYKLSLMGPSSGPNPFGERQFSKAYISAYYTYIDMISRGKDPREILQDGGPIDDVMNRHKLSVEEYIRGNQRIMFNSEDIPQPIEFNSEEQ